MARFATFEAVSSEFPFFLPFVASRFRIFVKCSGILRRLDFSGVSSAFWGTIRFTPSFRSKSGMRQPNDAAGVALALAPRMNSVAPLIDATDIGRRSVIQPPPVRTYEFEIFFY